MQLRHDPFNAFLDHSDTAVSNASGGPLAGLTLAVKDIYDITGQRSGGGNPQRLAEIAPAKSTAPSIRKLLDAGARFVGRTQTDELTFSLMGQNAHYPEPINAAAPDRVTGGSSSGSAAAVAAGLVDIAIGSETGGSPHCRRMRCVRCDLVSSSRNAVRQGIGVSRQPFAGASVGILHCTFLPPRLCVAEPGPHADPSRRYVLTA